ncbi:MAG: pectate lyase [candidate division KSB1 bacterium]|nr:pectate lyase [candidate division KSB1 bacterium]MDZ7304805.1 pectate lyase [candidate division KSB1 bacterium]MDZ7312944.1 pectate lyase [candidate division KSB1 bacterium]
MNEEMIALKAASKFRFFLITLSITSVTTYAQQLAFPGAEGYGRFTSGGRGGRVIEVTNLHDSGSGSLRAAIQAKGARTIVFRLSGTIALRSALIISNGDLTIAGQTAPGDGICLRDYPLIIAGDNVIIRHLRIRLGDVHKLQEDAISCIGRKNIIVDHCSMSWGIDEVASFYDNENATVQWCLISESLNHSFHRKGDHGYGGIWGGKGATFHHNLLAHHSSRNPRFNGSRTHGKPDKEVVDFRNNVIYNWGENSSYGGEAGRQNIIANYYKYGPATRTMKNRIVEPSDAKGRWYVADNFVFGFPDITADNWAGGVQGAFWKQIRVESPHPFAPVVTHTAEQAYELVLAKAGAILPKRDSVDARIIAEVRNGTATYGGTWGKGSGIIDSQMEVGGWPTLHSAPAQKDDDHDGMADEWELANGLDPSNPDDRNGDFDGTGYTNLEKYLNGLAEKFR